jgi:hypothetical protein
MERGRQESLNGSLLTFVTVLADCEHTTRLSATHIGSSAQWKNAEARIFFRVLLNDGLLLVLVFADQARSFATSDTAAGKPSIRFEFMLIFQLAEWRFRLLLN